MGFIDSDNISENGTGLPLINSNKRLQNKPFTVRKVEADTRSISDAETAVHV